MFESIGENEIETISIQLEMLSAIKKIYESLRKCNNDSLNFNYNEDEGTYAYTQIHQYNVFQKLKNDNLYIRVYTGDLDLLRDEIMKLDENAKVFANDILVEPIILQLNYEKEKENEYKKKIETLLLALDTNDPYKEDTISFESFTVTTNLENDSSQLKTELYFPCTVNLNDCITDAILELFNS